MPPPHSPVPDDAEEQEDRHSEPRREDHGGQELLTVELVGVPSQQLANPDVAPSEEEVTDNGSDH